MARRSTTVRKLAIELDLDLDDVLVTLWENGLEEIEDVDDIIPARDIPRANHALGISTLRERRTVKYWQQALELNPVELRAEFSKFGINLSPNARMLPKGALSKLRQANLKYLKNHSAFNEEGDPKKQPPSPEPALIWRTIGNEQSCIQLTTDEIAEIHRALEYAFADTSDPIDPPGVRDRGLLESAAYRPQTNIDGRSKYPTPQMTAAALLHSLIHNHPFHNGNKRTALVSMLVSLDHNGTLLTCSEQELFRYVLLVAQHRIVPQHWSCFADHEVLKISTWIVDNSRPLRKGDKAITWRELRRNLARLGCTFEGPLPGNKMKIRRVTKKRRIFAPPKERELIAHAWYGGEGREVHSNHLSYIRQELELDDLAGYDSACFYGNDPREPDEFIAEYRNILKRLARL